MVKQITEREPDSSELFPGYRNNPIVDQIPTKLKPYQFEVYFFRVPRNSVDFQRLSEFLACTLEELPLNNEVGETLLLRPDATRVVDDLAAVLRGKKSWEEIAWIFNTPSQLYKNKVFPSHNIKSAICYNIDLSGGESQFEIDRIHVITKGTEIEANYDGKFKVRPNHITVEADNWPIGNIHYPPGVSRTPNPRG